ncbi:MAG: hypothetical protein Q4C50_10470 [Eubacteriales bacterium]|nr:hypothetical protein [Eubacteriales bacterium]
MPELRANRAYRSRLFELIFSDKEKLLELYNAVNGTAYSDPDLLEINTLENAIYLSMHNDVSFVIDSRLSLYEHQSTYNPNLPLRYLMYVADLYSGMVRGENQYGHRMLRLPPPRFIIFYNGREERPDVEILKLSDAYTVAEEEPSLELKAVLLNINPGHNRELKEASRTLGEYAAYTNRVREYAKDMCLEDAVERAITECIREGILGEFLEKHRAEAKNVSIYEYDEEKVMQMLRQEALEDGREEGIEQGIEKGAMRMRKLVKLLMEAGRMDDLRDAAADDQVCKKLYEELNIE